MCVSGSVCVRERDREMREVFVVLHFSVLTLLLGKPCVCVCVCVCMCARARSRVYINNKYLYVMSVRVRVCMHV